MRALPLLAGVVAGSVLGWGLARGTGSRAAASPPGDAERPVVDRGIERPPGPPSPAVDLRRAVSAGRDEPPSAPDDRSPEPPGASEAPADLFPTWLREHVREGLLKGWSLERSEEMPEARVAEGLRIFEETVRDGAVSLGRKLAREETKRQVALTDVREADLATLLQKLDREDIGPVPDLVRDDEAFGRHFRPSKGAVRNALQAADDPLATLEDGVTLVFPAGVFALGRLAHPAPRDVTVRGAGMDLTLLVSRNLLHVTSLLENLGFQDCTIFSAGPLVGGSRGTSLRLDRVRLIGFDIGAGASNALNGSSLALWARDCRIEGGYGRHPRYGQLFSSASDDLIARFDGCWLEGLNVSGSLGSRGTVVFSSCILTGLTGGDAYDRWPPEGLFLVDSRIEFLPEGVSPPKKDLNDLFPDWEQRLGR